MVPIILHHDPSPLVSAKIPSLPMPSQYRFQCQYCSINRVLVKELGALPKAGPSQLLQIALGLFAKSKGPAGSPFPTPPFCVFLVTLISGKPGCPLALTEVSFVVEHHPIHHPSPRYQYWVRKGYEISTHGDGESSFLETEDF